jgi:hypothetical protein
MEFDELRARIRGDHGTEVGAVRVSLGLASNFQDVLRLVQFIQSFRDGNAREVGRAPSRANGEGIRP